MSHALQILIERHHILRTALRFDTDDTIIQHCVDINVIVDDIKTSEYPVIRLHHNDQYDIEMTIDKIINGVKLFDLSKGHVIQCHVLHRSYASDDGFIKSDDLILFCMHHSVFDGASTSIFFQDLTRAYDSDCMLPMNDNALQYIDYAVHEHQLDMTSSQTFWRLQLKEYNLQRPLSLPSDRNRLSADRRSAFASVAQFTFENNLSLAFLSYVLSHKVTPFQLGLASFYVFLFKLSHGRSDLCISSINANRYRPELQNMIGMVVATLPYRMQLDSYWSFDELVKHVGDRSLAILEHSHYPLQHILSDMHENQTSVSFLETVFDFITISSDNDQLSLDGTTLKQMPLSSSSEMAKFDFSCTFVHDPMIDDGELSCRFVCSHDMYDEKTVTIMSQRFQHLLRQLFSSPLSTSHSDQCSMSIKRLSLILPEESEEMEGRVFHRLADVVNEGM